MSGDHSGSGGDGSGSGGSGDWGSGSGGHWGSGSGGSGGSGGWGSGSGGSGGWGSGSGGHWGSGSGSGHYSGSGSGHYWGSGSGSGGYLGRNDASNMDYNNQHNVITADPLIMYGVVGFLCLLLIINISYWIYISCCSSSDDVKYSNVINEASSEEDYA